MDDKNLKNKKEESVADSQENAEEVIEEKEDDNKDEKDVELAELSDQLKRAVADYRNLERRSYDERIDAIKFANKQLVEALLPAFDTLFLAGKYTTDDSVKLTIIRILEILKENGIEKVDTNDAKYNADTMEAVEVIDGEEGQVIEEIRPGFIINGRLIRPAQVKVGGANQ